MGLLPCSPGMKIRGRQLGSTIVGEQPLGFLGFTLGLGALGSELVLSSVLEVRWR